MKKPLILILAILALIAVLFTVGIIPRLIQRKEIEKLANGSTLPRVTLTNLVHNTNPIELILPSSAQALHFTPIWARVNGYLLRFLVDIGDKVKEGDLLAEIDTPETDEELARAKADLQNSIVERDIAKITSDRWQRLWDKNREAVSKQEVDQYTANLNSAEAIVLANKRNVDRLTYQQQFKNIYAPFDGFITKRSVDTGTLIYGNLNGIPQELFEMAKTPTMRFFVEVPQTYFTQIEDGIPAEVTVLELPGKVYEGKVTRFAKSLNPQARTMQTQVDVDNSDGVLYPGIYGRVKFAMKPGNTSFIVPTSSIIIRSSTPEVAIVDSDDVVHMQKVQIGRDFGNKMEITFGLKEGDNIVTIPNDRIKEGVKVEVIK